MAPYPVTERVMVCEFDACPAHPGRCPRWAAAPVQKSGLTCGNDGLDAGEHGFDRGKMAAENEAVRACVNTPDPATPTDPERQP